MGHYRSEMVGSETEEVRKEILLKDIQFYLRNATLSELNAMRFAAKNLHEIEGLFTFLSCVDRIKYWDRL